MKCPYCGEKAEAEFIDIGVGMQQVTPYECAQCHSYEIGPYEEYPEEHWTADEKRTGWHEPVFDEEGN